MFPGFGDLPVWFAVGLGVFALFFVAVVALIVTTALRSRRVLRENGLDPLAAGAQLAARLSRGPLATPPQTLAQRLSELDDLHRRGMITEGEYSAARTAALGAR